MLRQLSSQGSRQERAASREALKQYDALVTYMERREEIGAAAEALEPHRSEFDKLLQDENAYLQRTEALFAEERFAEMRFTAAEVRRALSKSSVRAERRANSRGD